MSVRGQTISNKLVSLAVDARGRIVSLRNRTTGTELIGFPEVAEAWRMAAPTGRHTLAFLLGSEQKPARIVRIDNADEQSICLEYEGLKLDGKTLPIRASFTIGLRHDDARIACRAALDNRSRLAIDEVEFPIIGGLGGFSANRKLEMRLVEGGDGGVFHGDVLNQGLPSTGRASNHYVREHETCMFANAPDTDERHISPAPIWLDLWSPDQGLHAGFCPQSPQLFAFKLEKFPKEVPIAAAHAYPKGTARWIRLYGLHMPRIQPGRKWTSEPVILAPHAGGWQAGADLVANLRNDTPAPCPTPAWMEDFVGWTEIIGWLYTGEVFHDYAACAEKVIRDARVTGINFIFYYGHTALGAEGADFDNGPCEKLGGEQGFRRMVENLHRHGIRIMLLDHLHRWVNRDVPEYKRLGLERWAMRNKHGHLNKAYWWKETGLSCLYLEGPTPEWIEMCPACPEWREHYTAHVRRMIDLGVDGLELDTFNPDWCYNPGHPHEPGVDMFPAKLDFMRKVREAARRLNPDFVFFAETMSPRARSVVDGFYPYRFPDEHGRIYRYLFPQIREQAVLVGNYAYDQVNKALQLGIGVETEIWGLRKTTLDACPELAKYIGEVNRFKRRHRHILMHGVFRDTLGADVKGNIQYSVIKAANGDRALILRNSTNQPVSVEAVLGTADRRDALRIWHPFRAERRVRSMPVTVNLKPWQAAVVLACRS